MLIGLLLAASLQTPKPDKGTFVVTLGRDTIAVERYVRTKQQLISDVVYRVPQTRAFKLTITYNDKGAISWYELIDNRVAGVPKAYPMSRSVITLSKDSANVMTWVDAELKSATSA